MSFWVYILHCANGSHYTGHTDDLERWSRRNKEALINGVWSALQNAAKKKRSAVDLPF